MSHREYVLATDDGLLATDDGLLATDGRLWPAGTGDDYPTWSCAGRVGAICPSGDAYGTNACVPKSHGFLISAGRVGAICPNGDAYQCLYSQKSWFPDHLEVPGL